jgi:hypothetical protein
MGSIPVANPAPLQRPHLSRRGLLVLALPLAVIAATVTVVAFAWPTGPKVESARWIDAGTVDALNVGQPVRVVEGRFWLVKQQSGEMPSTRRIRVSAARYPGDPMSPSQEGRDGSETPATAKLTIWMGIAWPARASAASTASMCA